MKVAIAGGGFGGVKAALELAGSADFDVTLISDRPNFEYHAVLYRLATGRAQLETRIPLAEIFAGKGVTVVEDSVAILDPETKTLQGVSGKAYPYDALILALGNVTNYFGIKGLKERSFGIKSIAEATELRQHLHEELTAEHQPDPNYVVIGGGATGVELAAALTVYLRRIMACHGVAAKNFQIDLIEAAPRLLPKLPEAFSQRIADQLHRLGVRVYTATAVQAETADQLELPGGRDIKTKTVIWTAGVANNPFFSVNATLFQLAKNGHVTVGPQLEVAPDIYVIGDNADTKFSGLAVTALADARFVTDNLRRQVGGEPPLAYRPKPPITVIPVGEHWAAVSWRNIRFYGYPGWLARRWLDLSVYRQIVHPRRAWQIWRSVVRREEDCPICLDEAKHIREIKS